MNFSTIVDFLFTCVCFFVFIDVRIFISRIEIVKNNFKILKCLPHLCILCILEDNLIFPNSIKKYYYYYTIYNLQVISFENSGN